MNIRITHNWLLEYLDTDATPVEIQKYLSLCGPSVETVTKMAEDYVYEIEITSNRIDTASVLGIAQEAAAILPMFGKKAKLRFNPLEKYIFNVFLGSVSDSRIDSGQARMTENKLYVEIKNSNLCFRFAAIVLDNIEIKSSPDFISQRLTACVIKSINNVVDISNYLMLSLGQPVHVFDYDEIKKSVMIMRESKKGEKIVTLDEKEIILPGGDIVIEDGEGRLIDLCGIMGGANSAVSDKTKRIILFVQTYDKQRIRRTSMFTGLRTVAATYFEKGLDKERVEPTLVYGVELLHKYAGAKIASPLYDIYPKPYRKKLLVMSYELLEKTMGVKIPKEKINTILKRLEFKIDHLDNGREKMVQIIIPSWRADDINILEDLVEEAARIYGYHNLPDNLPAPAQVVQPEEFEKLFNLQQKIKYFLKHLGLTETVNYSMISRPLIEEFKLDLKNHLRLSNTISKEIECMRTILLPSLYKNLKDNTGKTRHNAAPGEKEVMRFFEIAKVYLPRKNDLPEEVYKLGIAVNTDYSDLKGIVEVLYQELNIKKDIEEKIVKKEGFYLVEIDLVYLINNYQIIAPYKPINPYAVIKLDLTIDVRNGFKPFSTLNFATIKKIAFTTSKFLEKIELIDIFKNKITLRFYFTSRERNITEEEAKHDLEKIRNTLRV